MSLPKDALVNDMNRVDSYFIKQVHEFIDKEIAAIDEEDKDGQYFVYRTALQMVINQCPTLSSILSLIDRCYYDVVDIYTNQTKTVIGSEAMLSRAINCQASIKHQEKRISTIQRHLRELKREEEELNERVRKLDEDIIARRKLCNPNTDVELSKTPTTETDMKYFALEAIDDYSVETDTGALESRLKELDEIIRKTNLSSSKEWIPMEEYEKLNNKHKQLATKRTDDARKCSDLYLRHERLRYAVEALREISSDHGHAASVGEAIVRTFKNFRPDRKESFLDFLISMSDHSKNYQGENVGENKDGVAPDVDVSLAEWLRKTHKLLSNGSYMEAAETAASAPSGMLCNLATLEAFQTISNENESSLSKSPVLFYLEAVLGHLTANYYLSEKFIEACVMVALEHGCYWLISSWIAKRRLPFSLEIINLLLSNENPSYLPLAESLCRSGLFDNPSSQELANLLLKCLIKQNRISAAVLLIRQYELNSFNCAEAFVNCPNPSFWHELLKQSNNDIDSLLSVIEMLPHVAQQSQNVKAVQELEKRDGALLLDNELLVLLRRQKQQTPELGTKLANMAAKLSQAGLVNVAARLLL